MAIFTDTPIVVESSSPFFALQDIEQFSGRFYFGGFEYLTGVPGGGPGLAVAKRATGSSTWTVFYSSTGPTGAANPILDAANSQIRFIQRQTISGNRELSTRTYDLTNDTFSSIVSTSFAGNPSPQGDPFIVLRPDGAIRVVFAADNGGNRDIMWIAITAGSFGSPSTITTQSGANMRGIVCDSSNVTHLAYRSGLTLYYDTLDASDTPGTPATIVSDAGGSGKLLTNSLISSYGIVFFEVFRDPVRALIGTPVNAPVWTAYDLHSATPGLTDGEGSVALQAGELKFFYSHTDGNDPTVTLEIMQVRFNGSVQTPEVYWDAIADPPPGSLPTFRQTDGITADFGTTLGVAVTTTINSGGDISTVFLEVASAVHMNRIWFN